MGDLRFDQVNELIARVEWLDIALNGTKDSPGLLKQLNHILEVIGSVNIAEQSGHPSLMGQLDVIMTRLRWLSDERNAEMSQQSQLAVREAGSSFRSMLDKSTIEALETVRTTLPTIFNTYNSSLAQLLEQAGELESNQRFGREQVQRLLEESRSTFGSLMQQSSQVVDELQRMLSVEHLSPQIQEMMRQSAIKALSEVNGDDLRMSLIDELQKVGADMKQELVQTFEGIVELVSEGRQESAELVSRLIRNRGPSDTIVALHEDLHAARAELEIKSRELDQLRATRKEAAMPSPAKATNIARTNLVNLVIVGALASIPSCLTVAWLFTANGFSLF